jgi:DNA-directed RNA polymerase subunit RPC12/RpoP
MPMYDRACPRCSYRLIDSWEPVKKPNIECPECGAWTERVWLSAPPNVIGDDIPGCIDIRHGLCHEDGTPQRFYSKSEIRREAERRGFVNRVEHKGSRGSDKSKHTTRWI